MRMKQREENFHNFHCHFRALHHQAWSSISRHDSVLSSSDTHNYSLSQLFHCDVDQPCTSWPVWSVRPSWFQTNLSHLTSLNQLMVNTHEWYIILLHSHSTTLLSNDHVLHWCIDGEGWVDRARNWHFYFFVWPAWTTSSEVIWSWHSVTSTDTGWWY